MLYYELDKWITFPYQTYYGRPILLNLIKKFKGVTSSKINYTRVVETTNGSLHLLSGRNPQQSVFQQQNIFYLSKGILHKRLFSIKQFYTFAWICFLIFTFTTVVKKIISQNVHIQQSTKHWHLSICITSWLRCGALWSSGLIRQ